MDTKRNMGHVRGAPCHPQTQGKIERWHQTLKNRILLENYYLPGDLEARIDTFVDHYNHRRYHESLDNLTPADIYSEESADHGGGLFTSAVLDALSKKETDRNHNGAIEASELYVSVKRAVVEATQGRQTPWFARNDMVGDFVPF
jgi:hypothetical protein